MTYNIRYDNPDDGIHAWPNRRDSLLAFLRSQKPAILCIQEGLHRQVAFLKSGLPGFDVRGVGRDDGKEKGEYAAVFYDTTRFSSPRNGSFWLSPSPDVPSTGWDAALPRIVTWVQLVDRRAQKTFLVFNTHFDHEGVLARENSARLVLAKIRDIAGTSDVILTGDFNSTEVERPYQLLVSPQDTPPHLADAMLRSITPPEGPGTTFTGFELKDPEPGNRIDYVFVSDGMRVANHRILIARSAQGYLSDHLPVVADVVLP